MARPPVKFDAEEAQRCADEWRFNCGPGALCAIAGRKPKEALAAIPHFKARGYTNPKMMRAGAMAFGLALSELRSEDRPVHFLHGIADSPWPYYGLVRIQWAGPWTVPGVPVSAWYRHSHWIAVDGLDVFDINCMCVGGWVPLAEWTDRVVPWLTQACEPKATGWWPTHCWRVALGVNVENEQREKAA